jgi:hypothetical protein
MPQWFHFSGMEALIQHRKQASRIKQATQLRRRQPATREGDDPGQQRAANFTPPSERLGTAMTEPTQRADPHVGIFWIVQTADSGAKLLAAGCPLGQAEPYGDCLTYAPGHRETWAQWRCDRTVDPALVRTFEYEDWPRGRIVFDLPGSVHPVCRPQAMTPERIARLASQFHVPEERTEKHMPRSMQPNART